MNDADISSATAIELADLVKSKAVSIVELVRATLDRIDRLQPVFNCFITVCHEEAMAAARDALLESARLVGRRGGVLLRGVPGARGPPGAVDAGAAPVGGASYYPGKKG